MPTDGILMLVPVREGCEKTILEALNRWGNDVRGIRRAHEEEDPRVEFPKSPTIHFARLTLLDDPDRAPTAKRLLIVTDYDGSFEAHAEELFRLTRRPDALWGCCAGYNGPKRFSTFVRDHLVTPTAYYIAFRDETLDRIGRAVQCRHWYEGLIADRRGREALAAWPDLRRLIDGVYRSVDLVLALPRFLLRWTKAIAEVVAVMGEFGIRPVLKAALRINATLDRVSWIRVFNRLLHNQHPKPPHPYSQAEPGEIVNAPPPGYPPEDAVAQNQLTLVTDIQPGAEAQLQLVLMLVGVYGRFLSNPGELVGISTIHTVRWAVIDDGRRLIMASNYDGTWEHYIDEFAEMILSGLDAIWSSSPHYPQAGAQDVAALKSFLRRHQAHANVFYSAYPCSSVLRLKQDLRFLGRYFRVLKGLTPEDLPLMGMPRENLRAS